MQPNEITEALKRLQLFNDNAKKLEEFSFIKKARNTDGIHVLYHRKEQFVEGVVGADEESLHAMCLPLRFFRNDTDGIALQDIVKLYQIIPIDNGIKRGVLEMWKGWNVFLNRKTGIGPSEKPITNHAILDTFMNGNLAHASGKVRRTFETWQKMGPTFTVLQSHFEHIAYQMIERILWLKKINVDVMKALEQTISEP